MSGLKDFETLYEISLLDFFEAEPIENNITDGYFCYEVNDKKDHTLKVSFDVQKDIFKHHLILTEKKL